MLDKILDNSIYLVSLIALVMASMFMIKTMVIMFPVDVFIGLTALCLLALFTRLEIFIISLYKRYISEQKNRRITERD